MLYLDYVIIAPLAFYGIDNSQIPVFVVKLTVGIILLEDSVAYRKLTHGAKRMDIFAYLFPAFAFALIYVHNDYRMSKRLKSLFAADKSAEQKAPSGFLYLYHCNRNRQISLTKFVRKSCICGRNLENFDFRLSLLCCNRCHNRRYVYNRCHKIRFPLPFSM